MKFGFISLGCSKNLVDSERFMGFLVENDHQLVNDPKEAEVIIINTCGFINSAKQESIDTILEMAEYKKFNCRRLIVAGCLVQRYIDDLKESLPEIDHFITIDDYDRLPEIFSQIFDQEFHHYGKNNRVLSTKPWMAYLKIAEGCSNRCSYCSIPLIRGDYRSKAMSELIVEAQILADNGVKELVLIAQDTTRYGYDLDGKLHLLELLQNLSNIDGFHWIRILYMYPDEITEELVLGMKQLPKVLPYFDIPVQHGSDKMLLAMNRRGTKASILETVKLIRNTFELPALRTTVIVGFPGETDDDYAELLAMIKNVGWDRLGAFDYSHEEDTKAYDLLDDVDEQTKTLRLKTLMEVQQAIVYENNQRLISQTLEVLIESYDALKRQYRGRSLFSAPDCVDGIVYVRSEKTALELGNFYQVKITSANAYDLMGHIID